MRKCNFDDIEKYCEHCKTRLILKNNRDVIRKRFCCRVCRSSFCTTQMHKDNPNFTKKAIDACNTPDANKKKGKPGELHCNWIKDRTKLKAKRYYKEEKDFIADILKERNYTCALTGKIGGRLSAHHKNSYKDFPKQRFDKNNIIVIQKEIHRLFHNKYGTMNITESKWNEFVKNKEYYAVIQ